MPVLCFNESWILSKPSPWKPKDSREYPCELSFKILITVFSPKNVGKVETRKEIFSPFCSILNLPSCGNLFSSSFKLDNTLIRAVTPGAALLSSVIA